MCSELGKSSKSDLFPNTCDINITDYFPDPKTINTNNLIDVWHY